jgi:hypothetical protein
MAPFVLVYGIVVFCVLSKFRLGLCDPISRLLTSAPTETTSSTTTGEFTTNEDYADQLCPHSKPAGDGKNLRGSTASLHKALEIGLSCLWLRKANNAVGTTDKTLVPVKDNLDAGDADTTEVCEFLRSGGLQDCEVTSNATSCWEHPSISVADMQRARTSMIEWYRSYAKEQQDDKMTVIAVVIPSEINKHVHANLLIASKEVDMYKLLLFYEYGIRYFIEMLWNKNIRLRIRLVIDNDSDVRPTWVGVPLSPERQCFLVRYLGRQFGDLIRIQFSTQESIMQQFHSVAGAEGIVMIPNYFSVAASLVANTTRIIIPKGYYFGKHRFYLDNRIDTYFQTIDVDAVTQSTTGLARGNPDDLADLAAYSHTATLGWLHGRLVNVTGQEASNKQCIITQYGWDGFGYQLEGKLSCIILSELWPSRFRYVHYEFQNFQHIDNSKAMSDYAENYVNLGGLGYERLSFSYHRKMNLRDETIHGYATETSAAGMLEIEPKCKVHEPTVVDNCWHILYREPTVSRLTNEYDAGRNKILSRIRQAYLATPKPDTGFERFNDSASGKHRTRNVVVHMRHGDSGDRFKLDEKKYFEDGMLYYMRRFDPNRSVSAASTSSTTVRFWIETDSPEWDVYQYIIDKFTDIVVPVNTSDSVFTVLHRMVMADGLVTSPSSLSNAAVLLSEAEVFVICDCNYKFRTIWMSSSRFVMIK